MAVPDNPHGGQAAASGIAAKAASTSTRESLMGFKLRGAVRCGACGKPRGPGTHLCNPGHRKRGRTRLQNPVTWECPKCHRPRGLRHTCTIRTDFAKRKRAAERERKRKRETAKRREKRLAATERRRQAAARRKAAARARKAAARKRPPRPRPPAHDYHACRDPECEKYPCRVYREGLENCPLPHGA